MKPKYFNCEIVANCKVCIQGYKYDTCKAPKNYSIIYFKNWKYTICMYKKTIC